MRLTWPSGATPRRVVINDVPVPLYELKDWVYANDRKFEQGGLSLRNMVPGRYQVCTDTKCDEGVLSIGGRLALNAPAP